MLQEARVPSFLRIAMAVPALFVLGMISIIWSAYTFGYAAPRISSKPTDYWIIVDTVVVQILVILIIISYLRTVFTNPGRVPDDWSLLHPVTSSNDETNDETTSKLSYCRKCDHMKPPRAHHCSVCNVCVLKMDHHCPWVCNCVGYANQKFFFQFVTYATLACTIITCRMAPEVLSFKSFNIHAKTSTTYGKVSSITITGTIMGIAVAIALVIFSIFHFYLILAGKTTIEISFYEGIHYWDLGYKNNWRSVMGNNLIDWMLPTSSTPNKFGDGCSWNIFDENYALVDRDEESGRQVKESTLGGWKLNREREIELTTTTGQLHSRSSQATESKYEQHLDDLSEDDNPFTYKRANTDILD